jgi:arylsulfatase A-like enzyme
MIAVDAAIEFMHRAVKDKKRFLAVVWFGSPHGPHRALDEDRRPYADQPKAVQHFLGEVTGMDRAFGKLRNEIAALGIRQNTILWYCSDNGALPKVGSTGGHRGNKGQVYDGGLLVPAILEWPARIPQPRTTDVRANAVDIYPTLLEIAGVTIEKQPLLDGESLVPLIDGEMAARSKPIGFWDYPEKGIGVPSHQMMTEVLEAQQAGREPDNREKLWLDADKIAKRYSQTELPGHSAWIDGDWKLHRIAGPGGEKPRFELYNLADDRAEEDDLYSTQSDRAERMKAALESWQRSVIGSLNGDDY